MTPAKARQLAQTIPEAFAAICPQVSRRIAVQFKQGDRYHKYMYEHVAQKVHCLANALIRQGRRSPLREEEDEQTSKKEAKGEEAETELPIFGPHD